MGRGGARPGSGRKVGQINRMTAEAREEARKTGEMPLDYMLRVMRDPKANAKRRDAMANACAPYLHPKLSAVQVSGDPHGIPVQFNMINRPPKKEAKHGGKK